MKDGKGKKWFLSLTDRQWRSWCIFTFGICVLLIGVVIWILLKEEIKHE